MVRCAAFLEAVSDSWWSVVMDLKKGGNGYWPAMSVRLLRDSVCLTCMYCYIPISTGDSELELNFARLLTRLCFYFFM